ncbi:MAG: hypothetical protein AAF754_06185 [Pseudomonadota bacterium]
MLQDKRSDLLCEKRKTLIRRLVAELSEAEPDFYYHPTRHIAALVENYVKTSATVSREDRDLLRPLARKDIEVLLSLH